MGSTAAAVIGVVGAGVSAGVSIKKMKDAKDMREEAEKNIKDFEYQDLNSLKVSTAMEDILQEESARNFATATESLRESGARSQAAALPRLASAYNLNDRKIYAGIDAKQKELDKQRVSMQEQRSRDILGGYGTMMNIGMQNQYQGMTDLINSVGNLGSQINVLSNEDIFNEDNNDTTI